jgi:Tol biopolymer transport system component
MTTDDRLVRDLPGILGELADGPYPDYIDALLADSATVRQRPGWTFPEWWLPMLDTVRRPLLVTAIPWRPILLVILMLALLFAAALYAGGQRRLPAPFGPASNGVVAYDGNGDIFMADPQTGAESAIVSGPNVDLGPRFSLDGTRLAFERKVDGDRSQVYVVRTDGRELTLVTPEPVRLAAGDFGRAWQRYEFAPDGRTLLIAGASTGPGTMTIANTDGSGTRTLDVGMAVTEPSFRPPLGREILFNGTDSVSHGLFVVDVATGAVRPIVQLDLGHGLAGPSWSPDGSQIAYWMWSQQVEGMSARTHVILADGSGDRELPSPPGAVWNAHAAWSNDGSRLFIARGYTPDNQDVRGAVIPADGSGFGREIAPTVSVETGCCAAWMWSPDDTKILGRPDGLANGPRALILDVAGGPVREAPWTWSSDLTWQRLAP